MSIFDKQEEEKPSEVDRKVKQLRRRSHSLVDDTKSKLDDIDRLLSDDVKAVLSEDDVAELQAVCAALRKAIGE